MIYYKMHNHFSLNLLCCDCISGLLYMINDFKFEIVI
jgi:hypothetical protein